VDFYNRLLLLFFYCTGIANNLRPQPIAIGGRRPKDIVGTLLLAALCSAFFLSCNHQQRNPRGVGRAFYYWKSTYELDPGEKNTLFSLHIRRLYIKIF
jgi:hypothetical protein